MAPTYTVDDIRKKGWYWQEDANSFGRRATLVGTCLNCNHPVKAKEAVRAVKSMSASPIPGKAYARVSLNTWLKSPGVWTQAHLPSQRTCACGKHGGAGCGATYEGLDQLLPVRPPIRPPVRPPVRR